MDHALHLGTTSSLAHTKARRAILVVHGIVGEINRVTLRRFIGAMMGVIPVCSVPAARVPK